MNNNNLIDVCVYPDGEVYEEPVDYKSDDYIVRKTRYCNVCGELIEPDYNLSIGYCLCGGKDCCD